MPSTNRRSNCTITQNTSHCRHCLHRLNLFRKYVAFTIASKCHSTPANEPTSLLFIAPQPARFKNSPHTPDKTDRAQSRDNSACHIFTPFHVRRVCPQPKPLELRKQFQFVAVDVVVVAAATDYRKQFSRLNAIFGTAVVVGKEWNSPTSATFLAEYFMESLTIGGRWLN